MKLKNLDHGKDWVDWGKIGIGFVLYTLWNRDQPMPLGFVWGMVKTKDCFEVIGSYVPAWARRMGIRSAINAVILSHYKTIVTVGGSKSGGEQFMKARGYKYSKETGSWFVARRKTK